MKRKGNLFESICSIENLELADKKASKGKSKQYGVRIHKRRSADNLLELHLNLLSKNYKTSPYKTFKVYEPKEREIFSLPYFPDRIVHHAIMNSLEKMFVDCFTADTYSCIKGKGIHAAHNALNKALDNETETKYCLHLDVKKFYPSIDHDTLKNFLRRKIKDSDLLWLLDDIIDSAPGLPIGNYLSQYFANFYLTGFDHWIKEIKGIRSYLRYADDMLIFAATKEELHKLLSEIKAYFIEKLKLEIKSNYQIYEVDRRGVNFVGYIHFRRYSKVRKPIKKNFVKAVKRKDTQSINSYLGWIKHSSGRHLVKTVLQA